MTRPTQALQSAAYDLADALEVNEFYQQRGWTDGLPIVPPTEERVWACLVAAGLAPGDLVHVQETSLGMAGKVAALPGPTQWRRRGPVARGKKPLTLTLSRRERGKGSMAKKVV